MKMRFRFNSRWIGSLGCLALGLLSSEGICRLATTADAPYAFNRRDVTYDIRKDGTYDTVYLEEIEVLMEGRKQEIGTRRIPYNSRTSKLTVLKAEVINGDHHQKVDSRYIEDKTLSSPEQGFDDFSQLVVAFPDVRLGSKLILQFRLEVRETPFEGHFSDRVFFGAGFLERASAVHIRSEVPIFLEKNDPSNLIEITQKEVGSKREIEVHLKGPYYLDEVNEYKSRFDFNDMSWVAMSTHPDFEELVRKVAPRYEAILRAPLPSAFQVVAAQAALKSDPIDQLNEVTSKLADRVRYTGDWRPIHGGHVPRPLDAIEKTGFGDCKDLATSVVAIVRTLGFEANVAWVERDLKPNPFPKLALQSAFNHAIAWVKKGDRVYWIDATNLQSFAQGVFEDINERPALIIDAARPRWEKISGGDATHAVAREDRHVRFLGDQLSQISSTIALHGRTAVEVTGAALRDSADVLRYRFATMMSRESDILSYDVDLDDLGSRVARDLKFKLRIDEKRSSSLSTAGPFYRIPPREEILDLLTIVPKDRVSGFFLGHSKMSMREIHLEDVSMVGALPKPCRVHSPWLSLSRQFAIVKNGIRISESVTLQRLALSASEIRGADFAKLQGELKSCYDLVGVVFRPIHATSH